MDEETRRILILLLARLERISADSQLAHQASGVRGSLIRLLDLDNGEKTIAKTNVKWLMEDGFSILYKAFKEKAR